MEQTATVGTEHPAPPRNGGASHCSPPVEQSSDRKVTGEQDIRHIESAFRSSPAGLCAIDLKYRYLMVNQHFAAMYGLPRSHFLGRTVPEALPHLATQIIPHLERSLSTQSEVEVELLVEREDPHTRKVEILTYLRTAQPMRGGDGDIVGFSIAQIDITQRKRAENVFHSSPAGLCAIDLDYRYLMINEHFAAMYGLPRSHFLGRTVSEALPALAAQIIPHLQRSLLTGSGVEVELIVERKNPLTGNVNLFTYLRTAQPMRGADGTIIGFSIAQIDITHRKRAESAFHSSPAGLCVMDLDFRYLMVNNQFAEMYGLPCAHFLGRTVAETLPELAPKIMPHLKRCLATESQVEIEVSIERLHAETGVLERLTYLRTARPMRGSDGVINGFSVALFDLTGRKQAEAGLRDSEENYRWATELNPHIPWSIDPHGNLVSLSPRFLDLSGLTVEQADLEGWSNTIHEEDRAMVWSVWRHSLTTGAPFDCTYRMNCAEGACRWMRSRAFPRRGSEGEILRWYGTLEDIHERKLLDEALKLKTERLEEVSAQLALLVREDHLTGLANRRHFDDALERETARSQRSHLPLTLIMIDVDHFKRYNDTYGHPAGDECLRAVAQELARVLRRQGDLAARYGGEEFVILLPDTPEESGLEIARQAIASVRALAIRHTGSPTGILTISAGVAMALPAQQRTELTHASALVESADLALYAAKSAGRDQVAAIKVLPPPPQVPTQQVEMASSS